MGKEEPRIKKFAEYCFDLCEREYTFVLPQEIAPEQMQAELNDLVSEFGIINIDRYDIEAMFGKTEKIGVGMAECRDEEDLSEATVSAFAMAMEGIGKEVPEKMLLFFAGDLGFCAMYDAAECIQKRFEEMPDIMFGYNYREDVEGELPAKVIILVG